MASANPSKVAGRRPGRPPKNGSRGRKPPDMVVRTAPGRQTRNSATIDEFTAQSKENGFPKRGRGRPRKTSRPEVTNMVETIAWQIEKDATQIKAGSRPRGRPPKSQAFEELEDGNLADVDTTTGQEMVAQKRKRGRPSKRPTDGAGKQKEETETTPRPRDETDTKDNHLSIKTRGRPAKKPALRNIRKGATVLSSQMDKKKGGQQPKLPVHHQRHHKEQRKFAESLELSTELEEEDVAVAITPKHGFIDKLPGRKSSRPVKAQKDVTPPDDNKPTTRPRVSEAKGQTEDSAKRKRGRPTKNRGLPQKVVPEQRVQVVADTPARSIEIRSDPTSFLDDYDISAESLSPRKKVKRASAPPDRAEEKRASNQPPLSLMLPGQRSSMLAARVAARHPELQGRRAPRPVRDSLGPADSENGTEEESSPGGRAEAGGSLITRHREVTADGLLGVGGGSSDAADAPAGATPGVFHAQAMGFAGGRHGTNAGEDSMDTGVEADDEGCGP